MAEKTKAQLTKEVEDLSKTLGVETEIPKDATNGDIDNIIADLTKKIAIADKAEKEAEEELKSVFPYSVAPGKSVTSKAGIKGEGEEVTPSMFANGKADLNLLVKRKVIVKK
jgi:hypothetical protein